MFCVMVQRNRVFWAASSASSFFQLLHSHLAPQHCSKYIGEWVSGGGGMISGFFWNCSSVEHMFPHAPTHKTTYTHAHTRAHTHTHTHTHTFKHTHTRIHHIHSHMPTNTHTYTLKRTQHSHTHLHTYTHTFTHAHTHTHIHTQAHTTLAHTHAHILQFIGALLWCLQHPDFVTEQLLTWHQDWQNYKCAFLWIFPPFFFPPFFSPQIKSGFRLYW